MMLACCVLACSAQNNPQKTEIKKKMESQELLTGADRISSYLPLLEGKQVGLLVNPTSEVNGVLLPDTLLALGVKVVKIFSPEHGFRGTADAGAAVKSGRDEKTGLPVISLYGNHKKPTTADLKDIDVLVYDLQDVGVRFYTYISTLEYALEACIENKVSLMVLDRPNPLVDVVDGPVLEAAHRSFVGMQSIPVIYGMTPGEYAEMLIGEAWVKGDQKLLTVIPCANYTRESKCTLPVAPSPNLKSMAAIYLYPSLCLFEGTVISVGRGTEQPFQVFGHPQLKDYPFSFVPQSLPGASKPLYKGQRCYGRKLATDELTALSATEGGQLRLQWIIEAYQSFPDKENFFNNFFVKLAGTNKLKQQIEAGLSEAAIKESWQADLNQFKTIRSKYLLYPEVH